MREPLTQLYAALLSEGWEQVLPHEFTPVDLAARRAAETRACGDCLTRMRYVLFRNGHRKRGYLICPKCQMAEVVPHGKSV